MKHPAELADEDRRESEVVTVTLMRGRWVFDECMTRRAAHWCAETVAQRQQAQAERDEARHDRFRFWWSGAFYGAALVVFGLGGRWWVPPACLAFALLLYFWPQVWDRITAWHERRSH